LRGTWRGGAPGRRGRRLGQRRTRAIGPRSVIAQAWPRCLLLAFPGLAAAQQREADVAVHVELLPAVLQRELHLVDLAVLGIEDLAAVPHVAVLAHAPQDGHALDRLVLALAVALRAFRMLAVAGDGFRAAVEQLHHLAFQRAVRLADLDDGLHLA